MSTNSLEQRTGSKEIRKDSTPAAVEFRFLELEHYDNEPHFRRFSKVLEARKRECTVLVPAGIPSQALFEGFLQAILVGLERKQYLPLARFCDGEYSFYSGRRTDTCWGERQSSLHTPGVEDRHLEALRRIGREGFLCPNVNQIYLGEQTDFLEYLTRNGARLDRYMPFYFVYALLTHPLFLHSLSQRHIALITNSANKNLVRVKSWFEKYGVAGIEICEIPSSGVAHGSFELQLSRRPDVAFVGAGIGAPLVLSSLAAYSCISIDAGFAFHLWDGSRDAHERLFLNYS